MNYKILILNILLLHSVAFCNAILTDDLNTNSLNLSFSYFKDNHNLIADDGEIIKLDSNMRIISIGYILKGKYEFNLIYKHIDDLNNGFMLPFIGGYNFFSFKYHLKEREKFPINVSFDFGVGLSSPEEFNSNNFGVCIYKEIFKNTYPTIPYISFNSFLFDYPDEENINAAIDKSVEFMHNKLGFVVILPVKDSDNDLLNDSIWMDISINEIQKDLYLGITFGLDHPISF